MQIKSLTSFIVTYSHEEYKVVTQALGVMAGISEIKPKPTDIDIARELNVKMLEAQAHDLQQKLEVVAGKINKAFLSAEERLPPNNPFTRPEDV